MCKEILGIMCFKNTLDYVFKRILTERYNISDWFVREGCTDGLTAFITLF